MIKATPRPLNSQEPDLAPPIQESGWAPGPVRTDAENLASQGSDPRTVQPVASSYTLRQ